MAGRLARAKNRSTPRLGLKRRLELGTAKRDPPGVEQRQWDEIYDRYFPYVLKMLSGGLGVRNQSGAFRKLYIESHFDVEDLCQEVFAQFYKQYCSGSFDTSRDVKSYIAGITKNLALRHVRKTSRETVIEDIEELLPPESPKIEDAECGRLVHAFRASLDEQERAVFVGYFEDEKISQAALGDQLGLSRDQVARTIMAIRKKAFRYFQKAGWLNEA